MRDPVVALYLREKRNRFSIAGARRRNLHLPFRLIERPSEIVTNLIEATVCFVQTRCDVRILSEFVEPGILHDVLPDVMVQPSVTILFEQDCFCCFMVTQPALDDDDVGLVVSP